jgi:hypothetical protein
MGHPRDVAEKAHMDEIRGRWLRRAQIALAAFFTLGASGFLAHAALRSPDVPFIWSGATPWIWPPIPPQTRTMWLDQSRPRAGLFERHFLVDRPQSPVMLHVRAMRELVLHVNGHEVALGGRDPKRWKQPTAVDIAPLLVTGDNILRAEVRNPYGVGLLQLRIDGTVEPIVTDERWLAAWEGESLAPAAIADDGARLPDSTALPAPMAGIRQHALALLALWGGGLILFLGLRDRSGAQARAPTIALALVVVFWAWLFLGKIARIPSDAGFDAPAHLAYIASIMHEGMLPLANQGLATSHPPLFYGATALLLALVRTAQGSVAQRAVLSLLPVLSGLGMAFVAVAMARLLVPDSPWMYAGAIMVAGLLPMNLTLAASVSSEALHALLASLALLAAVRALLAKSTTRQDDWVLGLFLSLALLTKYTSAILVPILVGAVAVKRWLVESAPPAPIATGAARTLAAVAGLAGWVYVRNWLYFGDPFVWPLDAWPGKALWQFPDFHTLHYFLRFGDALTQPWYSGFHGFWDSLYTTLWGDGMLGGAGGVEYFHGRWRSDWMAAVFLLALPATAFVAMGWIRAGMEALRDASLDRRLALSLVVALPPLLITSIVNINLRYPFWSFGKAFYALFLTPTLAVFGVLGFDSLDRFLARRAGIGMRSLPWGWAAAFLGAIAVSYGG